MMLLLVELYNILYRCDIADELKLCKFYIVTFKTNLLCFTVFLLLVFAFTNTKQTTIIALESKYK